MLYMKEMRPVVQSECTLKESAAINQILGRRVRTIHYPYFWWTNKHIFFAKYCFVGNDTTHFERTFQLHIYSYFNH